MNITFYYGISGFRVRDAGLHKSWITRVIRGEERKIGKIDFIFTDDANLLGINREFLNHDYLTDVISFDYSGENGIVGEVYISIDRVKENAGIYGSSFSEELRRVMVHGALHLCGYNDGNESEAERMREREDHWLDMWSYGTEV